MRILKSIQKEMMCHMFAYWWGICLAFETFYLGLFQHVKYQVTANYPQYHYREHDTPCNCPNIISVGMGIH